MGNLIGSMALSHTVESGINIINVVLTAATTSSVVDSFFVLGTRRLALEKTADNKYVLPIYVDSSVSATTETVNIKSNNYGLRKTSDNNYILAVKNKARSTTVDNGVVIHSTVLSVNSFYDLICKQKVFTPDEVDYVPLNKRNVKVVRSGDNWYLAVASV